MGSLSQAQDELANGDSEQANCNVETEFPDDEGFDEVGHGWEDVFVMPAHAIFRKERKHYLVVDSHDLGFVSN